MKQYNYLSEDNRLERLSEMGDPLVKISEVIKWELFRPILEKAYANEPKGPGGRPAFDRLLMFKIVMLQKWYHIADDMTEYVINDRLSFQRFLGMDLNDKVPDAKTIWAYKERLKETNVDIELFDLFTAEMERLQIITKTGSIVDATFVEAPKQRNKRNENETIKKGGIPEEWQSEEQKNKLSQKDVDARWMTKNGKTYFGYKDHIKIDKESKMITAFSVSSASDHDSKYLYELLDRNDRELWADSAYTGCDLHQGLNKDFPQLELSIHEKGYSNKPLTELQKESNKIKSKIRARIEHIFGFMVKSMGGKTIQSVGADRAVREISMMNLAYNLRRYVYIETKAEVPI